MSIVVARPAAVQLKPACRHINCIPTVSVRVLPLAVRVYVSDNCFFIGVFPVLLQVIDSLNVKTVQLSDEAGFANSYYCVDGQQCYAATNLC